MIEEPLLWAEHLHKSRTHHNQETRHNDRETRHNDRETRHNDREIHKIITARDLHNHDSNRSVIRGRSAALVIDARDD